MKNIILILLLLSGCSTIPYAIEDVRVNETFELVRGPEKGCEVTIYNISTRDAANSPIQEVCGKFSCSDEVHIMIFPLPLRCTDFEAIRVDRKEPIERERFIRDHR